MPKRPHDSVPLPEPDRAREEIIARCRVEIESRPKQLVRKAMLPLIRRRYRMAELGEGFHWPDRRITIAPGARVGRFAYIGGGFEAMGPVVIGDLCMLAADCKIVGADHLFDRPGTPTRLGFPETARKVTIFEADAWVGQGVTIVEGTRIGAGAVIGSGSVVTRDVAPYAVVGGVPAKVLRTRFPSGEADAHDRAVRAASNR